MKVIEPSFEILNVPDREAGLNMLKHIEAAGRTCYKSEDKITDDSAITFVKNIMKTGHESVIEHVNISVRIICDRGVSHEIVRHRITSYSQESTLNIPEAATATVALFNVRTTFYVLFATRNK